MPRNLAVEFGIPFGNACDDFFGHFRDLLSFLSLEAVLHEPFADEFLGKLLLVLSAGKPLLISFSIEITGINYGGFSE